MSYSEKTTIQISPENTTQFHGHHNHAVGMPMNRCPIPGAYALAMAIAVTVAAVLVGGVVFGIYICVVKADGDPTTYYPLKVAFWAALAGGVFAFLVMLILYAVQKSRMPVGYQGYSRW